MAALSRPTGNLPASVTNVQIKSQTLPHDVTVSVLDIEDTSTSRMAQIEAIERIEAGEEVRGREVIRTVPIMNDGENDQDASSASGAASSVAKKSAGPHKLLLQDGAGVRVYGFEVVKVPAIAITNGNGPETMAEGLCIGAKLLLKAGTSVRRGMVMLEPGTVVVLGGKVDEWDKGWRATRKARLAAAIQSVDGV